MIRLYMPEPLESVPLALWFTPFSKRMLYKENLPPNFFETQVERVTRITDAQAVVLMNNFKDELSVAASDYIRTHADEAEKAGKPICAFSLGDFTDRVTFDPRVWVMHFSLYRSTARPRDISIPTLCENLEEGRTTARVKQETPMVSFCGQAGYRTIWQWLKYYMKVLLHSFAPARRLGVYWRRRMMAACRRSPLVRTNFIERRSFSGAQTTIELDPVRAREEFIDSIVFSDFVLAPKGDGNYSNRFLETLSLGRIPVVVDTDIVLPLEDVIDYPSIMVRVPMNRVNETPNYIRSFYDGLTDGEWRARQQLARATFSRYLRQDSFFQYFFTTGLQNRIVGHPHA